MSHWLIQPSPAGFHCEAGGFWIDPSRAVPRAVITHAHSDHAWPGSGEYLTSRAGVGVLRRRLGPSASIRGLAYGERIRIHGVTLSLHPAGHILGSAQVRIEHRGQVCVASGDYKLDPDATCAAFEPVRCHLFITESTFALPVYRFPPPDEVFADIGAWWRANASGGRTSVIFAYSLGKAQRILAGVDAGLGPIVVHESIGAFMPDYAAAGVRLPTLLLDSAENVLRARGCGLVLVPPAADLGPWLARFAPASTAMASGWMLLRRARQRFDRGFALSDHADWPGLLKAVGQTGAEHIGVTHGRAEVLSRWLNEQGQSASVMSPRAAEKGEGGPG